MNQTEIFKLSRLNTSTDTVNMPDDTLLSITNITYRKMINAITRIKQDFFYQEWTFDTVAGQSEYTFPVRSSTVDGFKKMKGVSIKWTSSDEYKPLSPYDINQFEKDKSYYIASQPQNSAFYDVFDKSFGIFPAPTVSVTGGGVLYGISDPKPLID